MAKAAQGERFVDFDEGKQVGIDLISRLFYYVFFIFRCSGVVPLWEKYWHKTVEKAAQAKKKVSIVWPLILAFGPAYALSAVYQLIYRY